MVCPVTLFSYRISLPLVEMFYVPLSLVGPCDCLPTAEHSTCPNDTAEAALESWIGLSPKLQTDKCPISMSIHFANAGHPIHLQDFPWWFPRWMVFCFALKMLSDLLGTLSRLYFSKIASLSPFRTPQNKTQGQFRELNPNYYCRCCLPDSLCLCTGVLHY